MICQTKINDYKLSQSIHLPNFSSSSTHKSKFAKLPTSTILRYILSYNAQLYMYLSLQFGLLVPMVLKGRLKLMTKQTDYGNHCVMMDGI